MRKIYQNIFSVLLLFAGVVIFSHSIIPHDHHYDQSCDTEHHEHHDTDHDSPMHCHFLNDVVFDDVVISSNQTVVNNNPSQYIILFSLNNLEEQTAKHCLFLIKSDNPPDYQVFLEHSPTRGSPIQLV